MNPPSHTVDALHVAFLRLADGNNELGKAVREELLASTGLSAPMIEWGLRTSLPTDRDVLSRTLDRAPRTHKERVAVILSGNLFTACIRALGWPLLLGASVVAKAASHDDVLPRALHRALKQVSPEVAARLSIKTFDRHDSASLSALTSDCQVVSAYGSDATLDALRAVLPASVPLVRHGHGVGVVYVAATALDSPATTQHWADRIALDIAAYDQRGCLSPHVVFVQEGGALTPGDFMGALATALADVEHTLPRGVLSDHDRIAQSQWRGLMASCGELFEAPSFGVAHLDAEMPIPSFTGPCHRNVSVTACADTQTLMQQLTPLAEHLKCIGVAGHNEEQGQVAAALPSALRPVVCAAGEMQTPAFDAPADGEAPWFGLT